MATQRAGEAHLSHRVGWLRAAVLGANDGIVSTASLILGVAAAEPSREIIATAGFAGLVAGAMSMAAGEFVSVSSQADTEEADLALERRHLDADDAAERAELAAIYQARGLEPALADQVAAQLMAHDALGAHARDELGIVEAQRARPFLAAAASAGTFTVGAALPLAISLLLPLAWLSLVVVLASLASLAALGVVSARAGGAPSARAALRVTVWGAAAMAATYGVGEAVGVAIA